MGRAGFSTNGSLAFLLVPKGGAVLGALAASWFADRFGPKRVVAAAFEPSSASGPGRPAVGQRGLQ